MKLAEQIPGFAGTYLEDGQVVVRSTLPVPAATVKAQAERHLPEQFPDLVATQAPIVVRAAEFTFPELRDWRRLVNNALLEAEGVVSTGMPIRRNRIHVGYRDQAGYEAAVAVLTEAEVPLGAFDLTEDEVVFNTGTGVLAPQQPCGEGTDLKGCSRPLRGGMLIGRYGDSPGTGCTLGFVGLWDGLRVFVTSSHCSIDEWATDGMMYFQPSSDNEDFYAGLEWYDPGGYQCNWWYRCRRSDAAVYRIGEYVPSAQGEIARPAFDGTTLIDPNNPYYRIMETSADPIAHRQIVMVGQVSGRLSGDLVDPSYDFQVDNPDHPYRIYRDHAVADYPGLPGNSGGPVFHEDGADAILIGIHQGNRSSDGFGIFSKLGNTLGELGSMSVLHPDASSGGPPPPPGGCSGGGDGEDPVDPC